MGASFEERDRQVIPRWGSVPSRNPGPDFRPLTNVDQRVIDRAHLDVLKEEWDQSRSSNIAADLVSTAITVDDLTVAKDAARQVAEDGSLPETAREIARFYLNGAVDKRLVSPVPPQGLRQQLAADVHRSKAALRVYPRDALRWSSLSRSFVALGETEKSRRAMIAATQLAPLNRTILRANARLMLHIERGDEALNKLRSSPLIKKDPWVLSAEIALSSALNERSPNIQHGIRLLNSDRIAPAHATELASAIATIHAHAGDDKQARKILRLSLESPTENALAQARWLGRVIPGMRIEMPQVHVANAFEAGAWRHRDTGQFGEAIAAARLWQFDQPFSSRPAAFGSFACFRFADDADGALSFVDIGLLSNPDDFTLRNNRAVALALLGRIEEAAVELRLAEPLRDSPTTYVVFAATAGLVAYRANAIIDGRKCYDAAVEIADKIPALKTLGLCARLHKALEEARLFGAATIEDAKKILDETQTLPLTEIIDLQPLRERLAYAVQLPLPPAHAFPKSSQ